MQLRLGIVSIIFGASMLIWTSFAPPKKEKKEIDESAMSIRMSMKKQSAVNWVPYLGTVLVAGGLLLVVTGRRADQ